MDDFSGKGVKISHEPSDLGHETPPLWCSVSFTKTREIDTTLISRGPE